MTSPSPPHDPASGRRRTTHAARRDGAAFKKDNRRIYLDNVAATVRGTDFIGIIDRRIQVVLISGAVELSARSNSVMLDRRGHTVYLDRTASEFHAG